MAPRVPDEIDVFTAPHSRMKELVNIYTRKVGRVQGRQGRVWGGARRDRGREAGCGGCPCPTPALSLPPLSSDYPPPLACHSPHFTSHYPLLLPLTTLPPLASHYPL
ncbi:hypothetical protein E2C01_089951 [Portunus trituberculatus]|uniref:Uncharacterized protein n=1 Tax=Portunus trituberculatus TaxID=210409 RepID=A0A5B7JNT6_PORTR|nr:hypothetical protein [Portunus trituberculatus]